MKYFQTISFLFLAAAHPLFCAEEEQVGSPSSLPAKDLTPLIEDDSSAKANAKQRQTLTGDWNGARSKIEDDGVSISAFYVDEFQGNPVGGEKKGLANAGFFELDVLFDLEKIGHFRGLSIFTSFDFRFGTNLSAKAIGNQFHVAEVYGGETYKLNELYLKKTFEVDACTIKAGRMNQGRDFLASPLYSLFVSLAFDSNPIAILFNTPFREDPFATWGAYLDFKPYRCVLLKFGVYNNNLKIAKNKYHGVNFTFHSTDGVMILTEGNYLNNQRKDSHGLAGNYKVGWYYSTGHKEKFEGGSQRGNFGCYFLLDQMIYRNGGPGTTRGLTAFGSFLFAPENRNLFPFFFNGGLIYQGIAASRPNDYLTFGAACGSYSSDLREVEKQAKRTGLIGAFGNQPQTAETLLELNYWAWINKWFAVVPDVQYIINPRGLGTIQDAFVIGVQVNINL